jgi:hypothetical protein
VSIPLATTTIAVRRPPVADQYAEPYSGTTTEDFDEVVTGVRAVIDVPVARDAGRERVAGGEQTDTEFRFTCDPCDITRLDYITDEATGWHYRVTWVHRFGVIGGGYADHVEGGLERVEGLV